MERLLTDEQKIEGAALIKRWAENPDWWKQAPPRLLEIFSAVALKELLKNETYLKEKQDILTAEIADKQKQLDALTTTINEVKVVEPVKE